MRDSLLQLHHHLVETKIIENIDNDINITVIDTDRINLKEMTKLNLPVKVQRVRICMVKIIKIMSRVLKLASIGRLSSMGLNLLLDLNVLLLLQA